MKKILEPLDEDEVEVTRLIPLSYQEDRDRARARQERESLFSTIFVAMIFLIAVLPLLWAGIR